jgi:DNA-binding SARP family transcriptional activator
MNPLDLFSYARDQLLRLPPNVTLAVFHPDFHGQHRLIAPLLRQGGSPVVFYSIPAPAFSLQDLLADLKDNLEAQLGIRVKNFSADPDAAAAQLADILNAQGPALLILDAYDQGDPETLTRFITSAVQQLKGGARVILGTRELPMALLSHEDLSGKITLIPVNPDKMVLDYVRPDEKPLLEVRALGPGRVLINGRLINHWDGLLPRALFFYFVDRGMTTRDEIFQTFWPNLSTREATNVFHVTKRKISEILGADLTVYWSGFYRISPELELHYDVVKFAEAVQNAAVTDDDEALVLLSNATDLYSGPYLSSLEQNWVNQRRDELAVSYAEALAGLARIYKNRNDLHNALGYFLRALAASPQREDLARAAMELYAHLGQTSAALEVYDRLEFELKQSLGVAPSNPTIDLAKSIRAGR